MSATKRHSSSRRVDSGNSVAKKVYLRQKEGEAKRLEAACSTALCLPFSEWLSPEDDEAFRDL
jgi:hypothetical protein